MDEIDQPLHKLGAPAMIFRPIIEIDHQRGAVGEPLADGSHHCPGDPPGSHW